VKLHLLHVQSRRVHLHRMLELVDEQLQISPSLPRFPEGSKASKSLSHASFSLYILTSSSMFDSLRMRSE